MKNNILDKYGISLKKFENRQVLVKGKMDEVEECIFIEQNNNTLYDVCEKSRNDVFIIMRNLSKEKAVLISVVLYKKKFDNNIRYNVIRELRALLENNEIKKVLAYFENFAEDIYVIGKIEDNKLSLVENNEGYSLFFNEKKIFEKAPLSRAYVVLFNYCSKITDIRDFYMENKSYFTQEKIDIMDVIEMYIL